MDVTSSYLNYTGIYCSIFSISTCENRKKRSLTYLNIISLMIFLFLSFFIIGYHLYFSFIESNLRILNITRIILNLLAIKNVYESYFNGSKFDKSYDELISKLAKNDIKKLIKMDIIFTIYSTTTFSLQGILCFFYHFNYGIEPGFLQLLGRQTPPSNIVFLIGLFNYVMLFGSFYSSIHHYNLIQYICYIACCNLEVTIKKDTNFNINDAKKYIRNINKLRKIINQTLGFHPFALLTIMWSCFVFGFAGVMTQEKIFTLYFAFITAGLCNLYCWMYALQMVHFSSKATISMNKIRDFCKNFACQNISLNKHHHHHQLTLTEYLMLEPLEPLSAWGCMELQPNILLSFLNLAIPFTVMIFSNLKSLYY